MKKYFAMQAGLVVLGISLSYCTPQQQHAVDTTLGKIDKALNVMECNSAVLRSTNEAIKDLCPVPKERMECPAMEQILADLAVGLESCKEGI